MSLAYVAAAVVAAAVAAAASKEWQYAKRSTPNHDQIPAGLSCGLCCYLLSCSLLRNLSGCLLS